MQQQISTMVGCLADSYSLVLRFKGVTFQ